MATIFKRGGKGNWVVQWYDHAGVRREKSSRTTDKRRAEQLASKLEGDTMLRREGIIDPAADEVAGQRQRPVVDHLKEYLANLKHQGCNPRHAQTVQAQLERLITDVGATRLTHLTANTVQKHLESLRSTPVKQLRETKGEQRMIGPRTINAVRSAVVAFLNWCVKTKRLSHNPCSVIPKVDESQDQRVKRRALTADELARLVAASGPRGPFYLIAALTGLRMREIGLITWSEVDLEQSALHVPAFISKAGRDDWIALPQQAVEALSRLKPRDDAPTDRVFPTRPTTRTLAADLKQARIPVVDAAGRRLDRHALRTTTGTLLARAGVSPQEAQRQMRHADIKTTLRHYTDLRLADQARAVAKLPVIGEAIQELKPTGTDRLPQNQPQQNPQQYPQHFVHVLVPNGATRCNGDVSSAGHAHSPEPSVSSGKTGLLRGRASENSKAGEEDRTPDIQLGN